MVEPRWESFVGSKARDGPSLVPVAVDLSPWAMALAFPERGASVVREAGHRRLSRGGNSEERRRPSFSACSDSFETKPCAAIGGAPSFFATKTERG